LSISFGSRNVFLLRNVRSKRRILLWISFGSRECFQQTDNKAHAPKRKRRAPTQAKPPSRRVTGIVVLIFTGGLSTSVPNWLLLFRHHWKPKKNDNRDRRRVQGNIRNATAHPLRCHASS